MQARDTATLGLVANSWLGISMRARLSIVGQIRAVVAARRAVTRSRVAVVASLVLPLAACAVGPDFVSPTAPLADNFTAANSHSIKTDHQDYRDWWSAFHDPTLTRLVQIAYNQNLTLLSAGTRVLQARAVLGIAVGEFYPQVQQGAGNLMYNGPAPPPRSQLPIPPPNSFGPIRLPSRRLGNWTSGANSDAGLNPPTAAYLASIANYDQVLVTLLGDVAVTYIGIRTTAQLIAIARDNVRKEEDSLKIARAKYQGGSTSELDVYQATTVLEATASAIPQLEIQLEQGRDALCVLLGIPPQSLGHLLARSHRIPTPPYTIAVGIPADLLRRRPDIAAAELAALAQSAQIGIAESQLYPAISISGTFGGTASTTNAHNLGEIFKSTGVAYAGGPAFQWNILNYGQITNNVRLQDATLQQLLVDYQNAVLAAQQQVDDGISTFLLSRSQAEDLRRSVVAANGTLKVATEQYDAGGTDFTTVLVAEQNLFQVESGLAVARANVSLGATAIYRALGGGWQIREDSAFVTAGTSAQMRARTNWDNLLPPADETQPPAPGLPSPADLGPSVRPPQW